jgi:hypothetical protein
LQAGPISLATTLGISVDFFSCSYLDVSVRRVRLAYLCIQYAMTLAGRVSPFGHLRIKARLPAPRSLSQATASFIACNRQGIHHVHLVACPYNVDLWSTSRRRCPKDAIGTRCVSYCRCMFDSIQSQPISASSSRTADDARCESLISTTSSNLLKNEQPH